MSRKPTIREVRALSARALASDGRRTGIITTTWDIAGDCQEPVGREIYARPDANMANGMVAIIPGLTECSQIIRMDLRCRKCDPCRRMRQREWAARSKVETALAARTWFGTLTLRPDRHQLVGDLCRQAAAKVSDDFDARSYKDQFVDRHRVISHWLTLWLKRVRKESAAELRFVLVAEAHKSGLPHYHGLIHEQYGSLPVRYRTLADQWPHGFVNFKLVTDMRQATYVCKYLSKSTAARVRASVHYGTPPFLGGNPNQMIWEGPRGDSFFEEKTCVVNEMSGAIGGNIDPNALTFLQPPLSGGEEV